MKQDLLAAVKIWEVRKTKTEEILVLAALSKKAEETTCPHRHLHIEAEWYFCDLNSQKTQISGIEFQFFFILSYGSCFLFLRVRK